MYTRKRSFALLIILLFVCTTVITTYAASNETRYTNFAGITTAIAQKYVSSNSSEVNCASYSFTQYPDTDITHIGYNTFSCTVQRSDGKYRQAKDLDGDLDYNDWHHSKVLTADVDARAGFSRDSTSAGSHDFGHYDGTSYNWDPSLSAQQTFFP